MTDANPELDSGLPVTPGHRNTYLTHYAHTLLAGSVPPKTRDELHESVTQANVMACHPPLPVEEVAMITRNAWAQSGDPLGKLNSPTEEDELDQQIEEGRKGLIPQSPQEQRAVQSMQSSQHAWHALQVERVRQIQKGYTPDHDDAHSLNYLIGLTTSLIEGAESCFPRVYGSEDEETHHDSRMFDNETHAVARAKLRLVQAGAVIAATLASMERRGL